MTFVQVWRAARRTKRVRPTRSSCSAPRSTTAGRHRCSRPGSITRSSCTEAASHRSSSSPAGARRATASPRRPRVRLPARARRARRPRSCARRPAVRRGSRSRPPARFLESADQTRRAGLRPVPRGSHRRHRRRGRPRRGDVADDDQPDLGCGGVAALRNRDAASRRRPHLRLPPPRAGSGDGEGGAGTRYADPSFGGGVIGNTAGSGPVIGGSSPPPRAQSHQAPLV